MAQGEGTREQKQHPRQTRDKRVHSISTNLIRSYFSDYSHGLESLLLLPCPWNREEERNSSNAATEAFVAKAFNVLTQMNVRVCSY